MACSLVLAGVVVTVFPGCGSRPGSTASGEKTARDTAPAAQHYALVYGRASDTGRPDVIWQSLRLDEPRVVYESLQERSWAILDDLGWLPSPDGRWLYVWDAPHDEYGLPVSRQLVLVGLPRGAVVPVGQLGGDERVLPYWQDSVQLVLATPAHETTFDVERRTLTEPLPRWAPPIGLPGDEESARELQVALVDYCSRRYGDNRSCLLLALEGLESELGVMQYLRGRHGWDHCPPWEPDVPEYFFLRSIGVLPLDGYRGERAFFPTVVCSPDGRLVARAGVAKIPLRRQSESGDWESVFDIEARVDVFDVASRKGVWATAVEQRGGPRKLSHPDEPLWYWPEYPRPYFRDLRWSWDGRYLSFTLCNVPIYPGLPIPRTFSERDRPVKVLASEGVAGEYPWRTAVVVVDTFTWYDRTTAWSYLYIPGGLNAFVVPDATETAAGLDAPSGHHQPTPPPG